MGFSAHSAQLHSDKIKNFAVKPQVCIVKKIGEPCELNTTVHWQTNEAMDLCLLLGDKVLQCWQNQADISEKLAIVLHQSTNVKLLDDHNIALASEMLEVNAVSPKKRRKRLRSAWSLF
jgi:hypothetical protein